MSNKELIELLERINNLIDDTRVSMDHVDFYILQGDIEELIKKIEDDKGTDK